MNDQQPTIQFTAEDHSVSITVLDPYGSMADERHARVVVRSGAFHGELASVLWTYDLQALQHLLTVLEATVGQPDHQEWRSMEDDLALTFELTPVGQVLLHVKLRDRSSDWSQPTTLQFTILADQTYLPLWREHVAQALEQMTPLQSAAHGICTPGDQMEANVTLYRPTGPQELHLVAESGYRGWPPRLEGQPIFYPVLNEEYATQIARDWNAKDAATGYRGYVTRFAVRREFLARYEVHRVGGRVHDEYWIPSEDLEEFNRNIVGVIEVIAEYAGGPDQQPVRVR